MAQCSCGLNLKAILMEYRGKKGSLIPVLQKAQGLYGYLSKEVLREIAAGLDLPFSQVYGVATFYSQFHLTPRGRNVIRICQGTACHVRGADKIINKVQDELNIRAGETTEDLRFTIESVACLGACGLAPVLMINDDTHGRLTTEKVSDLLKKYE